jgi:tRNA threonylcarbamoyladenosine biosynthesis protein TsaE
MEFSVSSIQDLKEVSLYVLNLLQSDSVVAFEGQMGAGKTTFVQETLKAMGIEELDGSPTYSLVNQYKSPFFGDIYHLDLYRLKTMEEVFDIGIEDILYQNAISFIEWPEIMQELLPDNTIWVYIRITENNNRIITIKNEN